MGTHTTSKIPNSMQLGERVRWVKQAGSPQECLQRADIAGRILRALILRDQAAQRCCCCRHHACC